MPIVPNVPAAAPQARSEALGFDRGSSARAMAITARPAICETNRTARAEARRVAKPPKKSAVPYTAEEQSARTTAPNESELSVNARRTLPEARAHCRKLLLGDLESPDQVGLIRRVLLQQGGDFLTQSLAIGQVKRLSAPAQRTLDPFLSEGPDAFAQSGSELGIQLRGIDPLRQFRRPEPDRHTAQIQVDLAAGIDRCRNDHHQSSRYVGGIDPLRGLIADVEDRLSDLLRTNKFRVQRQNQDIARRHLRLLFPPGVGV